MSNISLKCELPPGDLCVLTAAIYSLHKAFPNKYRTSVISTHNEIFENNPYISESTDNEIIEVTYQEMINYANYVPVPFLMGFVQQLGKKMNLRIPLATNKPMIYLNEQETNYKYENPYIIINAGVRHDCPTKQWPFYQEVVQHFKDKIQFIQIGLAKDKHQKLEGAINKIGKTNLRELITLSANAICGIGPVTLLQHLCAAFEKPYFCLLGGRESITWCQYPKQQTFHTIGQLDCCQTGGCWKTNMDDCKYPLKIIDTNVPKCMTMIKPKEVIQSLERYLTNVWKEYS